MKKPITVEFVLNDVVLPAIKATVMTQDELNRYTRQTTTRKLASGMEKDTLSGVAYHPEPKHFSELPTDLPKSNKGF